jgi:hypothetical protein
MNDTERMQDRATTTEQIAAAGTASGKDGASPPGDAHTGQLAPAMQAGAGGGEQRPAQLLADNELQTTWCGGRTSRPSSWTSRERRSKTLMGSSLISCSA